MTGLAPERLLRSLPALPADIRPADHVTTREVQSAGCAWRDRTFTDDDVGKAMLHRELLARELFAERPWMPHATQQGPACLRTPAWPRDARLDELAGRLDGATRRLIARQAGRVMLEVFLAGYAHRDFRPDRLYWVDSQLVVDGWELLESYPDGMQPAFPHSYDIVGYVSDNPVWGTTSRPQALCQVLGVTQDEMLEGIRQDFLSELRLASVSFQGRKRRKSPKAGLIYSSFDLPHLKVHPDQTQRNSARRLNRFGVNEALLGGRSLLDLGSHIGGMVFESQKFGPARSIGVEYDKEKVALTNRIAAYNGLRGVRFLCADIDQLNASDLGGVFDIVYCLAIEAHVHNTRRLYELLGVLTGEVLLFEGNSSTNPAEVERRLAKTGFRSVNNIGMCDDDALPQNNNRPMFIARK